MSDGDLKILAEDIIDYCNAEEAVYVALRLRIEKLFGGSPLKATTTGSPKLSFDASKIQWKKAEGGKGPFEIAEKKANTGNADYAALEQFLENAGGRVSSEGYFIWQFPKKDAIGKKLKK